MNTDNLSAIWFRQPVPRPIGEKELLAGAAVVRRRVYFKHGFSALLLIGTLIYINVLVYFIRIQLPTTRIGIALISLAIAVYLAASGDSIYLWLKRSRADLTVSEYLAELLQLKKKQQFLTGRLFTVYFVLLMAGLLLYLLEFVLKMRLFYGLLTYGLTVAWAFFSWVVLRPRQARRHTARIDATIVELERMARQLHNSS